MSRTRAGWTTEHQCGCVTSVLGDGEDAVQTVSYCPKHKAAPEMYEALKELVKIVPDYVKQYDWLYLRAVAVLARAEGKEARV